MNPNPYTPINETCPEDAGKLRRAAAGRSVAFVLLATVASLVSLIGFAIAERLDDLILTSAWAYVYLPTLAAGTVGSFLLFLRSQLLWQRAISLLAAIINVASGTVTAFLWWLFSTPFSTG